MVTLQIKHVRIKKCIGLTDTSVSRDRDSDNEDWEEKEASRTHSVKFTEDVSDVREVRYCCCFSYKIPPYSRAGWRFSCTEKHAYKHFRYNVQTCFHSAGSTIRDGSVRLSCWFRRKFRGNFSRQRAYLALSSILVAFE